MADTFYCEKCNRTMDEKQFYGSNNTEKYPQGKLHQCKKCVSLHVDNFNPDTYLWILQECDVPYVKDEWNNLLMKYGKDKSKLTGMTILGRYLSKMKLKQFGDYRWKDTEFLQEMANKKIKEAMKDQGYGAAEIAEAIERQNFEVPEGELVAPPPPPEEMGIAFPQVFPGDDLLSTDLTDEDRIYLSVKWGRSYRPDEWVRLEQLYNEMMESYDIQTAGHIDTLKLICKTSLKANQLLDLGDVDGAQKMVKMYDSLMKSGKFTAAQIKSEQGEFVDSVSEIVALCEKEGFIPRYYVDGPQDKVDKVLLDTQHYVHNLVTEEMGLGNLIENAVKLLKEEKDNIAAAGADGMDEGAEDDLFDYDKEIIDLTDEDYQDFRDAEDDDAAFDEEFLRSFMEEEE